MRRLALLVLLALAACGADGPPVRPGTGAAEGEAGEATGEAFSLDLEV